MDRREFLRVSGAVTVAADALLSIRANHDHLARLLHAG
jgi:hypothetical protein